ncbi:MAG: peptidoglycan editing factor PgeF [Clostridiales bacterium]|nr:peptidoglycan editing factor PgeF [Clostridiales bacterium]
MTNSTEHVKYQLWNPYTKEGYGAKEKMAVLKETDGVCYFTFPELSAFPFIRHGFSTRLGGVSKGELSSMNLSYSRGDEIENVTQNYRRMGRAIGFSVENLVLSDQIHETKVIPVTKRDCQGSELYTKKLHGVDGLVTNEKDVVLATSYADCVPLFFVDPEHQAIGSSHAGWRGTVGEIGKKTVETMAQQYGSKPEKLHVVIGPSICAGCYEVSEEVAEKFRKIMSEENRSRILWKKEDGKYQLDLWLANRIILEEAGVAPEHISIAGVCTCCNPKLLFSHRYTNGRRGNLNGFLMLVKGEEHDEPSCD